MGDQSGTELSRRNHYKITTLCVCYIQWNLIDTISWEPENKAYYLKIVSNVLSNEIILSGKEKKCIMLKNVLHKIVSMRFHCNGPI